MSGRSFRSVFMVASCAGAALACYLVSLRVASERAALEDVEQQIVLAERDIRVLQTEIGTRGRLAQLEKWNASVLALSAPSADQLLEGGFALAKLARPQEQIEIDAPVVLAAAPAAERSTALDDAEPSDAVTPRTGPGSLMHQASLKVPERTTPSEKATATSKSLAQDSGGEKKSVDNKRLAAAKPVTKPAKVAKADPLAPLPEAGPRKAAKETGSAR